MTPTKKDWEEVYSGVPMFDPTPEEVDDMARIWEFSGRPVNLPTFPPHLIAEELSRLEGPRHIGKAHEL